MIARLRPMARPAAVEGRFLRRRARSEQPAQEASEAGQQSLEKSEYTDQQTADGTTETPQEAHRATADAA